MLAGLEYSPYSDYLGPYIRAEMHEFGFKALGVSFLGVPSAQGYSRT